jgi:DNA-binding winged helix-turn-helix (wHTH) protein/tetratricopeptide (TPR) repeat protein
MSVRQLSSKVFRFGLFELDLETQQLRKGGVPLRIQPQPFKVLAVLMSHSGSIVTREELRRELWGTETFVDFEQGLNYCIRQIRAVLDDDAQNPHYVETIPRRGYRFIASIEDSDLLVKRANEAAYYHRPLKKITASVLAVLALISVGLLLKVRTTRRPLLTIKDYLLVTEFSNQTGDPIFDATLRKAVSIDLGQSPYLNIVPDDKIRQALSFMGKPAETRVTPEVGREICRRNGFKAMLTGSLTSIGNRYQLALEVLNASSGEVLAEERVQASGKDEILNALDRSNEHLREKLGESLSSIRQFDKPLAEATTSSLEALQLYTLGTEKRSEGELAAIPFFERAIQLDPDFALAHASLGTVYLNVEQLPLAEEHEKRAMTLSDRVSEREKFYITAHYYLLIGKREKVVETYEAYARLYPQDVLPQANLANEYNILGEYDKALDHALMALQIAPDSVGALQIAATAYAALDRLEDAKVSLHQALKLAPDGSELHLQLSNIAIVQGDIASREREDAALRATPGGTLELLYRDASLAACRGRLRESEDLYEQASQLALKLGLKDNASFAMGLRAVYEAYLGQPSRARESAKAALRLSQMSDTIEPVAVALAVANDNHQAETLIDGLAKRRPDDTTIQFVYAPMIHATGLVRQGDPEQAVRILSSGIAYDRGNLDSMLARANAYLAAKHLPEAVNEFQRLTQLRAGFPADPACTMAQLGLARAYALSGNQNAARSSYQEFLSLWKDAEPDEPILQRARVELGSLP